MLQRYRVPKRCTTTDFASLYAILTYVYSIDEVMCNFEHILVDFAHEIGNYSI